MKFTTIAVALTLATQSAAFAPNNAGISTRIATPASHLVVGPAVGVSTTSRSTELNLFGWGKAENLNKAAKVDGEITEKEVRALFELWNSALATGDSRIVASRYIKVCCIIIFWRVEQIF